MLFLHYVADTDRATVAAICQAYQPVGPTIIYYYYYYAECQINDNMFRPFLILTRPSSGQT